MSGKVAAQADAEPAASALIVSGTPQTALNLKLDDDAKRRLAATEAPKTDPDASAKKNLDRSVLLGAPNSTLRSRSAAQAASEAQAQTDPDARQLGRVIVEGSRLSGDPFAEAFNKHLPVARRRGHWKQVDPVTGQVCEGFNWGFWTPFATTVCTQGTQGPGTPPGSILGELNRR